MCRFLPQTSRILRVYIESFTGVSHVCHPGGPNNPFLSQGCVLETAPAVGTVGQMLCIPRTRVAGGGGECLIAQVQLTVQPGLTPSRWPPTSAEVHDHQNNVCALLSLRVRTCDYWLVQTKERWTESVTFRSRKLTFFSFFFCHSFHAPGITAQGELPCGFQHRPTTVL